MNEGGREGVVALCRGFAARGRPLFLFPSLHFFSVLHRGVDGPRVDARVRVLQRRVREGGRREWGWSVAAARRGRPPNPFPPHHLQPQGCQPHVSVLQVRHERSQVLMRCARGEAAAGVGAGSRAACLQPSPRPPRARARDSRAPHAQARPRRAARQAATHPPPAHTPPVLRHPMIASISSSVRPLVSTTCARANAIVAKHTPAKKR